MNFDAVRLQQEINDCRHRALELTSGLAAEQLTWRPLPDKWSIAECFSHLNMTAATVQSFMHKAIERGRQEQKLGAGPFYIGLKGRLLVWIAEPPPKFRLPAPKAIRPPVQIPAPHKLVADFLKVQDEWERLIRAAEGLDLARIKIGPATSAFRARLAAGFPWMMAHQRRHLMQAENIKKQLQSSASGPAVHA